MKYDFYRVLEVRSDATDDEIRLAFRRLVKQLHPDLHPGDAIADRRFRIIVRAYETLSHPVSRAAYDAEIAGRRSSRRHRLRTRAATMVASFALTCLVLGGVLWRGLGEPPLPTLADPTESSGHEARANVPRGVDVVRSHTETAPRPVTEKEEIAANESAPVQVAAGDEEDPSVSSKLLDESYSAPRVYHPRSAPIGLDAWQGIKAGSWARYHNARYGFALGYPPDVFVVESTSSADEQRFRSRDGRARLLITATLIMDGLTLSEYRRALVDGPYKDARFDYSPQRPNWFVLSGTLKEEMFYERVTFSCDGRALHRWKLVYPLPQRGFYDRIVEEMHRRYSHGNGPGARCGQELSGRRREREWVRG